MSTIEGSLDAELRNVVDSWAEEATRLLCVSLMARSPAAAASGRMWERLD